MDCVIQKVYETIKNNICHHVSYQPLNNIMAISV